MKRRVSYVIVEDGWIPGRVFDDGQKEEALRYVEYCNRNYVGYFECRTVNESDVTSGYRQFCKAIGA